MRKLIVKDGVIVDDGGKPVDLNQIVDFVNTYRKLDKPSWKVGDGSPNCIYWRTVTQHWMDNSLGTNGCKENIDYRVIIYVWKNQSGVIGGTDGAEDLLRMEQV